MLKQDLNEQSCFLMLTLSDTAVSADLHRALCVSKDCDKELQTKTEFFRFKDKHLLLFTHCSNPQVLLKIYFIATQFTTC